MKKRVLLVLTVFLLWAGSVANAQTLTSIESSDVIPDIPQTENEGGGGIFLVQTGVEFGFGNITVDDYAVAGENGQSYIKYNLSMIKSFGPLFLMGQVSDALALASDFQNLLDLKFTSLLFIPPANLIAGVQFSGSFPFYEGRLVETPLQIPAATHFWDIADIAKFGIIPGLRYTQPFGWGQVYGSFLLPMNRPLSANDWSVQGSPEIGINTAFGIGAFVSPTFTFLGMDESAENAYTNLKIQLNYGKIGIPLTSSLTFTLPGSQKDGFKNFGMFVLFDFHAFFFHPLWDIWLSAEFLNVGNGIDKKVGVVPTLGATYTIPLSKPGGAGEAPAQDTEPSTEPPPGSPPPNWYIGLAGGYTNNGLYTSTAGRAHTGYESGHGFEAAVPVRYQVMPWFAVQWEIQYIQKNFTMRRTDRVYTTETNDFIDLPVMVNFSAGNEKLRAFTNLGAYAGMWISSSRKGTLVTGNTGDYFNPNDAIYHDFDEKVEFDKGLAARFDGGLLAGLGVQYAFRPCTVFLEGRYYHGLTDLQQNYSNSLIPRMNSTYNIRLGILFNKNLFRPSRRGN